FLGGERALVGYDHDRVYPLSEDRIVTADDRAFQNSLETGKYVFNFGAEHLEAAAIDHVLLAIEDAHKAVGIHRSDVPGSPKAVDEFALVGVGTLPITWHHHRPRDPDLTRRAPGDFLPLIIDNLDRSAGDGYPDTIEMIAPSCPWHDG